MTEGFVQKLTNAATRNRSWLCVGIDPVMERLPRGLPKSASGVVRFCERIIEATSPFACAFKPNIAFFEALGDDAFVALGDVLDAVPVEIPVILDAKRGDIGSTAERYAESYYDRFGVDAVTVNPYMGWDAVKPFAERPGKAAFVLCLTSNDSAAEVQLLDVGGEPLYVRVARMAAAWPGTCGLVVGATKSSALRDVRAVASEPVILIPGVGAQGGNLEESVRRGAWRRGGGALINVSRSILYASNDEGYAEAAAKVAGAMQARIGSARQFERSDTP